MRDGIDVAESTRRQWAAPGRVQYLVAKARHFPLRLAPRYGVRFGQSTARRWLRHDRRVASWGVRYPDLVRHELITVCARQWRWSVAQALADFDRLGLPVIATRCEALVADPAGELARLAELARLDCKPSRLAQIAGAVTPDIKGSAGRRSPWRSSPPSRSRRGNCYILSVIRRQDDDPTPIRKDRKMTAQAKPKLRCWPIDIRRAVP